MKISWIHYKLLLVLAALLMLIYSINDTQHRLTNQSTLHNSLFLQRSFDVKGQKKLHKQQQHHQQLQAPYSDEDNTLKRVSVRWGDFVLYPHAPVRTKSYIKPAVLKSLRQCAVNGSDPFERERDDIIGLKATNATVVRACQDAWDDRFLSIWKSRMVKGLCEEGAASRINCYDSAKTGAGRSRLCVFENAMMNFKKVRRRKVEGHLTRSWERGFLAADCGDMAADDIGYQLLYKPDIEGREDALCDYVFNETVLVYSHDNTRSFGAMVNDYLNVWTMLWLTGHSHVSGDISFLNMDAMKRGGKFNADQLNHYFNHYNVSFRRILKGVDFERIKAKVCFKRLIVQPRPAIPYLNTGALDIAVGSDPTHCESRHAIDLSSNTTHDIHRQMLVSTLFQRWNIEIRQNHWLLRGRDSMPTMSSLQILLLARKSSLTTASAASTIGGVDTGSRLIANAQEVFDMLRRSFTDSGHLRLRATSSTLVPAAVVMEDLSDLSSEDQMRLVGGSSILIGVHGTGMSTSVHMPVGTKYCCGVVEIFATDQLHKDRTTYGLLAKRMGHYYEQVHLPSNSTSTPSGSLVPIDLLEAAVQRVINSMVGASSATGTCIHPDVIENPYL